jgi:gliding motility-associated-like protein
VISGGNICIGQSTTVKGFFQGNLGPYTYQWSPVIGTGLGPHTVTPQSATTYTLIVTNTVCNNSISDSVTINVFPLPQPDTVNINLTGCQPFNAYFDDTVNSNATYLWQFGDGTSSTDTAPYHTYLFPGIYNITVTITSSNGCTNKTDNAGKVVVNPKPKLTCTATPNITDLKSPYVTFNVTDALNKDSLYFWKTGDGYTTTASSFQHTYKDTGTFWALVTVTNTYGCTDSCGVPVVIKPYWDIVAPNAFTPSVYGPNGGAYNPNSMSNEVFFPLAKYVTEFHMMIFNRWGELVFESFDINIGWDGYYRGQLLQQDVYVWKIEAKFAEGTKVTKVGDVTLLR